MTIKRHGGTCRCIARFQVKTSARSVGGQDKGWLIDLVLSCVRAGFTSSVGMLHVNIYINQNIKRRLLMFVQTTYSYIKFNAGVFLFTATFCGKRLHSHEHDFNH